jgi:hypothetical protein
MAAAIAQTAVRPRDACWTISDMNPSSWRRATQSAHETSRSNKAKIIKYFYPGCEKSNIAWPDANMQMMLVDWKLFKVAKTKRT